MIGILAISIGGSAIAVLLALLWVPWQVRLFWRKLWQGPWGIEIAASMELPGLRWVRWTVRSRRGCERLRDEFRRSNQWRRDWAKIRWWWGLLWQLQSATESISGGWSLEIGFDNPDLTGECLGLLLALPPHLQRSLRFNFERVGLRSRGDTTVRLRPARLLWQLLVWWWTNRQSPVA